MPLTDFGGVRAAAAASRMGIHDDSTQTSRTRRLARPSAGTLVLVVLLVAGLTAGVAASRPFRTLVQTDRTPFVPTDRTVKLRLLEDLPEPPRLLVLGGSRATRVEPARFERLTGLPGFNLALQNGRPEDAWAFVNLLRERNPGTPLQIVWFIHVEAFREQGLSPGLLQEPELSRWFPPELIATEKEKLPQTAAEAPKGIDLALTRFARDGVVLRNRYDIAAKKGRTLARALDWSIDTALERYATTSPALFPRSTEYFEKTLDLLSQAGTRQTVVLTPMHPRLLKAVRAAGWDERHREVMAYLRRQQELYGFSLLDCSRLSSIGGDPDAFYDGFHFRSANARRLVDAVVAGCPDAFATGTAPGR